MKIEKAIEGLTDLETRCDALYMKKDIAAIQLGIEALKWYKEGKEVGWVRTDYFLPGETEE